MPATYKPAAIDNAADFAADCLRRAQDFYTKAAAATDWTERDRLLRVASNYADDARFWGRPA